MAVRVAPESFHSVEMSIDGRAFTAHLWRGAADHWRVLEVDVQGIGRVARGMDAESCNAALEKAEDVAKQLLHSQNVMGRNRPHP